MSSPFEHDSFADLIKDIHEIIRDRPRTSRSRRRIGNKSRHRLRRHSALAYHTGRSVRGALGRGARLLMLLIGSVLVLVGMLLGLTLVGSICGLPLIFVGIVLFVRGLV